MYRCHFCGECSAPKAPMLRHSRTKVVPLLPKTETIAYKGEDGRIKRRTITVEATRFSNQPVSEVPVCKHCYFALKEGVSETKLKTLLQLRGKVPVSRRTVSYNGLRMFFGQVSSIKEVPLEAPRVKAVIFG